MSFHLSSREFAKSAGIGALTALILSAVMIPAIKLGIAPIPRPPSQVFAERLLGPGLPLIVGLLFHVAYLTFWSIVYVGLFRERLTFRNALWLSALLWALLLVVFFPLSGWGFLGLGISPKLIPASLVPHLAYAVVLWALCRVWFNGPAAGGS